MTHLCVRILAHHWPRWWLGASSLASYYLNQWWIIVNWSLSKFESNTTVFIDENAFEMSSEKYRPFCIGLIVLNRIVTNDVTTTQPNFVHFHAMYCTSIYWCMNGQWSMQDVHIILLGYYKILSSNITQRDPCYNRVHLFQNTSDSSLDLGSQICTAFCDFKLYSISVGLR